MLLLLSDKLGCRHKLFRSICEYRHFLSVFLLLIRYLTDSVTLIVQLLFFGFKFVQLIAYTDYSEESIRLFLARPVEKLRKIKRKLFYEFVEQLLTALVAVRINNLERTVIAAPDYLYTVAERNFHVGRNHRAFPHSL